MRPYLVNGNCAKCKGQLFLEVDEHGVFLTCLQCGACYEPRTKTAERIREGHRLWRKIEDATKRTPVGAPKC